MGDTDQQLDLIDDSSRRDIQYYDPDKGLLQFIVAETAERHFLRAKDATKVCAAIDAKIDAQADYIVWRDSVIAKPAERGKLGGRGRKLIPDPELALSGAGGLPAADPGTKIAYRWRKSFTRRVEEETEKGVEEKTVHDDDKIAAIKADAKRRAVRICEQEKNVRGIGGTSEDEWWTPKVDFQPAVDVLGEIDLDPATHEKAQEIIRAKQYFTKADDGLKHEWHGRVWLNPPYSQPLIAQFVTKMCDECRAGHVTSGIMLTHNYTDTAWFHEAAQIADAICFKRGRIGFYKPGGEVAEPTQGQAYFYFGGDIDRFTERFRVVGFVVVPRD